MASLSRLTPLGHGYFLFTFCFTSAVARAASTSGCNSRWSMLSSHGASLRQARAALAWRSGSDPNAGHDTSFLLVAEQGRRYSRAHTFRDAVFRYEEEKTVPYLSSIERRAIERGREEGRREILHEEIGDELASRFGQRGRRLLPKAHAIEDVSDVVEGIVVKNA